LIIAFCLLALLLAALVGITQHEAPSVLALTGVSLLFGTACLVRQTAVRRLRSTKTICVLFFWFAVVHIVFGYTLADLTTEHTSIRSNPETFYATAMLINCMGLFAGAVGYAWKLNYSGSSIIRGFPLAINIDLAERLFRIILLIGSGLMFFVYWKLGAADYLSEPSKWPVMRYITSDILSGSAKEEWLVNRAMDLLTVSLPFVLFGAVKHPRILRILPASIGCIALLLPLRRANLLAVALAVLILVGIERSNVYQLTRKVLVCVAIIYILSQCIFLIGIIAMDVSPRQVVTISSTALPEVRDLAWTLSLLHGESLNGTTFAQALIPLPSIASDWSSRHSLRAISTKLIGLDETSETGGLRLTVMGEGYINFGYVGAIAVGFLWGLAVGWCELVIQATGKNKPGFMNYGAALCFVWVCFLVYLAGTQAAASIKVGAMVVLGVAWASRERSVAAQLRSLLSA
jgi:hypothetical protein